MKNWHAHVSDQNQTIVYTNLSKSLFLKYDVYKKWASL